MDEGTIVGGERSAPKINRWHHVWQKSMYPTPTGTLPRCFCRDWDDVLVFVVAGITKCTATALQACSSCSSLLPVGTKDRLGNASTGHYLHLPLQPRSQPPVDAMEYRFLLVLLKWVTAGRSDFTHPRLISPFNLWKPIPFWLDLTVRARLS